MDMPFRIENKESFRIAGYSIQTTNKRGEGKKAIPSFWTKFKTGNLEKPCWKRRTGKPGDCSASAFTIRTRQTHEGLSI